MPKNYIQPTKKTVSKNYNRPSMKPVPAVDPQQLPREWNSGVNGPTVSYLTKVDEIYLESKHAEQRAKS